MEILSWKKIVLELTQNNSYFPWNLQFWNFPFLEFSTPGILSWNFLFLESYFTEFSCYRFFTCLDFLIFFSCDPPEFNSISLFVLLQATPVLDQLPGQSRGHPRTDDASGHHFLGPNQHLQYHSNKLSKSRRTNGDRGMGDR